MTYRSNPRGMSDPRFSPEGGVSRFVIVRDLLLFQLKLQILVVLNCQYLLMRTYVLVVHLKHVNLFLQGVQFQLIFFCFLHQLQ